MSKKTDDILDSLKTLSLLEASELVKQIEDALKDFIANKKIWEKKAELGKEIIKNKFTSELMAKNYLNHFIENY